MAQLRIIPSQKRTVANPRRGWFPGLASPAAVENLSWLRRRASYPEDLPPETPQRTRWNPSLSVAVTPDSLPWLRQRRASEETAAEARDKARWFPGLIAPAPAADSLPWLRKTKEQLEEKAEEPRRVPWGPALIPPAPAVTVDISWLRHPSVEPEESVATEPKRQPTWIYSRQAPIQPIPPTPPPPVPPQPPLPAGVIIDDDTLQAIQLLWQSADVTLAVEVIDDDTLQAIQEAWTAMALLPAFFSHLPQTGRLKSPQALPYAQVSCRFKRRELAGTAGAWHDYREVTIVIRGTKAQCVQAAGNVLGVFNRLTTLQYPSTDPSTGLPRFKQWWPDDEVELEQDEATKDGLDIWKATLKATVWSTRLF